MRHATSDKKKARTDNGLSPKRERQCDELYENMRKHAGYKAHIFSSPMKRYLETARKGLRDVISRGIPVHPMPALAGRNGQTAWNLREDSDEDPCHGSWVSEPPDFRSRETEVEFVDRWLRGELLPLKEAQKRVIQKGWKNKIVETAAKKKQLRDERVEKRGVEKKRIKKELESIEIERARLDRMLILLADQAAVEEIQKDWPWEESTEPVKLETKSEKLKRDLLRSQESMLVVDSETNEVVTFAEFQVLLKERHAKEFSAIIKPLKDLPETEEPTTKRSADSFVDPESSAKEKKNNIEACRQKHKGCSSGVYFSKSKVDPSKFRSVNK
ncbi:hypothetical protein EYC80_011062 [Monilinia laxa]|uniref:Uncharacterized protein n=1 Tax=Monilinia laxa TaxID=61186 RepID=A0A5N6JNV7_MONLA|nr:hypothetical protein EYC80_011062 [Monilinia laxa]